MAKSPWSALLQHLISQVAGIISHSTIPGVTPALLRAFVWWYGISLQDAAAGQSPRDYPTLHALFTRALRPDARPLDGDPERAISPVDGIWGAAELLPSPVTAGVPLLQAKGQTYTLTALLGGACGFPAQGPQPDQWPPMQYFTIYLAPHHYHRVHMPCDGQLTDMVHVGGHLFPVRARQVARIPGLFTRNERVVAWFSTRHGPMAVVWVGALCVGSISCVWHGPVVSPQRSLPAVTHWAYPRPITFTKGEEIGHFSFGSTVVVILPQAWGIPAWQSGDVIRMGQAIASAAHALV